MFWAPIIAAGIGAAGSIAGGLLNNASAQRGQDIQLEIAERNIALQREFAQMGVQWKAEDARKAGVHPLFGLGAQTTSFSPVSVGDVRPDYSWVGNAGQHLGRAAAAAMTKDDREQQYHDLLHSQQLQGLQVERGFLENQLLRSQIRRMELGTGPAMPTAGQRSPGGGSTGDVIVGPTGAYESKPNEVTTVNPQIPSVAAGPPGPQTEWRWSGDGQYLQAFPHKDAVQDQELTNPMMIRWMLTQAPWFKPPKNMLPRGANDWAYRPMRGWKPVYPEPYRAREPGPSTFYGAP